jgi:hypothetical protein
VTSLRNDVAEVVNLPGELFLDVGGEFGPLGLIDATSKANRGAVCGCCTRGVACSAPTAIGGAIAEVAVTMSSNVRARFELRMPHPS